jgi:hypothetical protein
VCPWKQRYNQIELNVIEKSGTVKANRFGSGRKPGHQYRQVLLEDIFERLNRPKTLVEEIGKRHKPYAGRCPTYNRWPNTA